MNFDNNVDHWGDRQLEEDMQLEREERADIYARVKKGREGQARQWNQDGAGPGMVRGQDDRRFGDGVEVAMKREIYDNNLRKREVANDLEQQQRDELQRR